jgi:exopolysaccharide biosynthesis polyprenyl glycosylphosphotransferase
MHPLDERQAGVAAAVEAHVIRPKGLDQGLPLTPRSDSKRPPVPRRSLEARGRPRLRVAGQHEALLAGALRVGAVLIPVGVVLLATAELSPGTLVAGLIAAALWFAALRRSYWSALVPLLVQGIGIASAALTGLAALSALDFWLPRFHLEGRQLLLMAAGVLVTSVSFEALVKRFESRRVLIVATSDGCRELLSEIARHPNLPFKCVSIVEDGSGESAGDGLHSGTMPELAEMISRARPALVVLGDEPTRAQALHHLLEVNSADFRVVGLHQFYEHAFGKLPVRQLSPVWFMSVLHLYQRPYSRLTKRIFDLALAAIGLAISAPLLLVLALLVRLSGPGPIIFRQVRLGEGGKTFQMLKLRTMVDLAEADGKAVWAMEQDPRQTRIGGFMRRTRLDELPQLWNVMRGEMSLVGPRPERPEFVDFLRTEIPFWTSRNLVKPGITGWAQVRLGYTSDAGGATEKLSYDLYYLRHRSVQIDLAIIAWTARTVLLGFAAPYRERVRRINSAVLQMEAIRSPARAVCGPPSCLRRRAARCLKRRTTKRAHLLWASLKREM